jgi:hypothetical protein
LIEERETEIKFLENEMLISNKKIWSKWRFNKSKVIISKTNTRSSFTIVQDIAESKIRFHFDKSSDLTMLFAKQFDIATKYKCLNRTEKREQLTKKNNKLI